nr:hypothetical protein [uncultured Duganella sp.]
MYDLRQSIASLASLRSKKIDLHQIPSASAGGPGNAVEHGCPHVAVEEERHVKAADRDPLRVPSHVDVALRVFGRVQDGAGDGFGVFSKELP